MDKLFICIRCNHSWNPRIYRYGIKPKTCPECRTLTWDQNHILNRNCKGICKKFLDQLSYGSNRTYVEPYNKRVVKKLSGRGWNNEKGNEYYYCQRCEIYMKKWLAFLNEITHRLECPCCGGAVRLGRRYSDYQNKEKYIY